MGVAAPGAIVPQASTPYAAKYGFTKIWNAFVQRVMLLLTPKMARKWPGKVRHPLGTTKGYAHGKPVVIQKIIMTL